MGTLWSPRRVQAAASERVRLGLIGCGPRGTEDLLPMLDAGAECVAVADPDDHRSAEAAARCMQKGQKRKPTTYRDFRDLLGLNGIDAVLVGTPDHWHAICVIRACMAGKDVFVEKPISHNIREGRAMVRAAHKRDRIVQVGTQQRSGDHFIAAKAFMDSGRLGKVCLCKAWVTCHDKGLGTGRAASAPSHVDYDLWLGPAPKIRFNSNRFHYQWRWFWDYAGGKQADWGIHLIDVIHWYMNVEAPLAAASGGGKWILKDNTETPDTQTTVFDYPGFTCQWEHRMGNARGIEDRSHGIAFYGENGTLLITRGEWQVFSEGDRIADRPGMKGSGEIPMFARHAEQFLRCVKTREKPNADIEVGHRSTSACQLGNIAFRVGRKIRWDAGKEEIIGDAEANAHLTREYREPWVLPEV